MGGFKQGGGIKGNLAKVRGGIASRSGAKISGENVAQAAVKAAEGAPASVVGPARKTALQAVDKFGGQQLSLPQALAEKTASGKISRSLAKGTVKSYLNPSFLRP